MPYDDRDEDDLDISHGRGRRGGGDIPNYLAQAIMATVCCCWPLGIVAIVNAAKVNGLVAQGDYEGARKASDAAKTWSIVSCVAGLIVGVFWVAIQLMANQPGRFR